MQVKRIVKKTLRVLGVTTGCVVLCVFAVLLTVPVWLPRLANPIISNRLGVNVKIDAVRLRAHRGYASVRQISVSQPAGFQDAPALLIIRNPQIKVRLLPLMRLQVIIPRITVDHVEMHVIRNAEGLINLEQLVEGLMVTEDKPPRDPGPPREVFPTLTLSNFALTDAIITFSDFTVTPPVVLALSNLQVHANALRFDPIAAKSNSNLNGRIRVEANIIQGDYDYGYLGAKAAVGIASTNIPPINAAARVVGFDIRSIRRLLPPGISTAIGGSNLDVIVDASVSEDFLSVHKRLQTSGNTFRLAISGTPQQPHIDRSTALFNLITRPGAFITGTVGGVADAGMVAGRTVISTAGRAGTGIVRGVANIGRGAARTAGSAARGDIRGIGDGVVEMTYGTVTGAVDTVAGTARGVGEGLGETLSAAAGRTQTRNWETTNQTRWGIHWENAQEFAIDSPFPGTITLLEIDEEE